MNPDLYTFQFRNITISGLPGGGSTTLLNMLREEFKYDGWKGFSGGEFMRTYAEEKGLFKKKAGIHHDSRHYEDDFDRQVDMGMREKLEKEEKWILEAWLSGFLAQGVPGVLKILVHCSDDAVRIDRIVNRDGVTPDDAKHNLRERYEANLAKWARLYQAEWTAWVVPTGKVTANEPIDFWKPDLYDVVIDTYSHNQEQSLQMVLDALKKNSPH